MPINNASAPMLQPQATYIERETDRIETVQASQNKNIFGGCGVTVAVIGIYGIVQSVRFALGMIQPWRIELNWFGVVVMAALGTGAVAYGWAAAYRNFHDEWEDSQQRKELHEANQELGYRVAELQAALEFAEHQLDIKRRQAALKGDQIEEIKIDERKYQEQRDAANVLIKRASLGQTVARDPVTKETWVTKPLWHAAGNILQRAGYAEWENPDGTGRLTVSVEGPAQAHEAYAATAQWQADEVAAQAENYVQP